MKCIALLHSIILDVEGLHESLSSPNVKAWMQITVLSLKNTEKIILLPLVPNTCEACFVNFSAV
jgi:hypothetical protein